jgi:hypothetical protein
VGAGYELLRLQTGNLYSSLSWQEAEADAAGAEVHGAGAAVLGARRIVLIAVRGRVREMALLGQMRGVLN